MKHLILLGCSHRMRHTYLCLLILFHFTCTAVAQVSIAESAINPIKNKAGLSVVPLSLDMKLVIMDSVRTLRFHASESGLNGHQKPVKTRFSVYILRTFSDFKIAETSTDASGNAEVKFTTEIPGDSLGNLKIICRVEDSKRYGTVETFQTIGWGIPTHPIISKFRASLWTKIAPTWMIVTLTILLLGVWGHYAYVIYKLYKIRHAGKELL